MFAKGNFHSLVGKKGEIMEDVMSPALVMEPGSGEMVTQQDYDKDVARAQFCLAVCPGCKAAREKQKGFWFQAVRLSDGKLCPWCAAYTRVTDKRAYEPISDEEIAAVPGLKKANA